MNWDNDYTINIKGGGKNFQITLSEKFFKFSVATLAVGLIIFVGACGYSVYSALNKNKNAEAVAEVQKAEELQQEQLLTISKKADVMSETLQNLTQQEEELRIQAGLNPPKKDDPNALENAETPPTSENPSADVAGIPEAVPIIPGDSNGQGGPVEGLKISDVSEALEMIEKRVSIRQESLEEFQTALKQRRETLAIAAAGSATAGNIVTASTITPLPNNVMTLDLSQFLPPIRICRQFGPLPVLSVRLTVCVGAAVISIPAWILQTTWELRLLQLLTALLSMRVGTAAATVTWSI